MVPGAAPEGPGGSWALGGRGGTLRSRGFDSSDSVRSSPTQREGTRRSKLACSGLSLTRGVSGAPAASRPEPPREVAVRCRAALGGRGERAPPAGRDAGLAWAAHLLLSWPYLPAGAAEKALFLVQGKFRFVPFPVT